MVVLRLPLCSTISSSTPVTVTVWAVSQLEVVKVNDAGVTVAADGVPEATAMLTLWVGWVSSTTV